MLIPQLRVKAGRSFAAKITCELIQIVFQIGVAIAVLVTIPIRTIIGIQSPRLFPTIGHAVMVCVGWCVASGQLGPAADIVLAVRAHFSPSMNPCDAAALFWYVRNSHFFTQALKSHPHVMIVPYEKLIQNPGPYVRAVYERMGCTYPGDHIVAGVDTHSLHKGESMELAPAVTALADDMLRQLDDAFADLKLRDV